MANRRPPLFTRRVFNPLAMRFGISGANTLTTQGRRTGKPHRVPVIPVEHAGERYLVSPRGETDWVRNLRAAGGYAELRGPDGTARVRATELPVTERPPILELYQTHTGRSSASHFKALPDPADHPVFRIERRA